MPSDILHALRTVSTYAYILRIFFITKFHDYHGIDKVKSIVFLKITLNVFFTSSARILRGLGQALISYRSINK